MSDNRNFSAACGACLIPAAIGSVLYASTYISHYDASIRHYDATPALYVFIALFIASVVIAATASLLFSRRPLIKDNTLSSFETFILWLTAFLFISFGVAAMLSPADTAQMPPIPAACARLLPTLSVASALSFILSISSTLRGSVWHTLSSFVPLIWTGALLFRYYYDLNKMVLNDPESAITSLCIACAMLFFLAEARRAFGFLSPAFATLCYLVSAAITGCISGARIVLSIISQHQYPSLNENIAFVAIGLVSVARLYSLYKNMPARESSQLIEYAEPDTHEESDVCDEREDI